MLHNSLKHSVCPFNYNQKTRTKTKDTSRVGMPARRRYDYLFKVWKNLRIRNRDVLVPFPWKCILINFCHCNYDLIYCCLDRLFSLEILVLEKHLCYQFVVGSMIDYDAYYSTIGVDFKFKTMNLGLLSNVFSTMIAILQNLH